MGILPKWLKEFPRHFVEEYGIQAKKNWPKFKKEVSEGVKTVVGGVAKGTVGIVKAATGPFIVPVLIILASAVVGFLILKRLKIIR